ncbi:MAG: hypothetical protein Q8L78_01685 [Coxiellaceae bacterium]|nr:hypothetical protein [Coxiellaceae bacterium]
MRFFQTVSGEVRDHFRYHVTDMDKVILRCIDNALKEIKKNSESSQKITAPEQKDDDTLFERDLATTMQYAFISYDFDQGGAHNRLRRCAFGENSFSFTDKCKAQNWHYKKYVGQMALTKDEYDSKLENIAIQNLCFVFDKFFASLLLGKTNVIPKGSRGMYLLDGFKQTILSVLSDGDIKFKMQRPWHGFYWANMFSLSQDRKSLVLKQTAHNDFVTQAGLGLNEVSSSNVSRIA